MKIYIVFGSTGEYSGRTEWILKAFYEEKQAKDLVINVTNEVRNLLLIYEDEGLIPPHTNIFDKDMKTFGYEIRYYYKECDLEDEK